MSVYGILVGLLLLVKLAASTRNRAYRNTPLTGKVAVVVPFFNEDPELLRQCLLSVLAQTRPPDVVYVIDDGSPSGAAGIAAAGIGLVLQDSTLRGTIDFRLITQERNGGKREAQAVAFSDATIDVFVTVDSDTVLDEHAVEEILRPMANPEVSAATGMVQAYNHARNLLTRLIDVRYANAFLFERAAYSVAGAVLCCCGSLSAYRATVVRSHLDDYLAQAFLGERAVAGDDRRMTNYCLAAGKVVLQPTAVAYTSVPERLGHFVRQQVRWNKSFFRESLYVVQRLKMSHPAFWLTMMELSSWIVFTFMLVAAIVVRPVATGTVTFGGYLLYVTAMSYARSIRYTQVAHGTRMGRLVNFAISPLYGLMHIFMLLPLRLYSLVTLRSGGWGTRGRVEVASAAVRP